MSYNMPIAEYVYIEHFKEMNVTEDIFFLFTSQNNNSDKFLYVYGLLKQYNWLPQKLDDTIKLSRAHRRCRKNLKRRLKKLGVLINMDCTMAKKNNYASDQYRLHGNEQFKIKNYEEALKLFTQSIMNAEIDSINFALSMANRSAALYYLKEYEHCLKDIDQVLISNKYPLQKTHKLLERKGNCYRYMDQQSLALEMYSICLLHLSNTTQLLPDEKEQTKNRILKFITKCEEKKNKKKINYISYKENTNYNSVLSQFIKIKYSKEMERGLFVSKDIKPGEILIIEKPKAGVFKNNMWMFNCNYCFKQCLSGIPCSKCSQVLYCNEMCLEKAYNKYHCIECSLIYPLKGDPTVEPTHDLAMRCFIQLINEMGIDYYCKMVQKYNENEIEYKFDESNNLTDIFYSIYALSGNETKRTVSNLFFMHCTASMMVSLLLLNDYYIPPNLLGIVGQSIVHLLCVVNLNSYASIERPKYINKTNDVVFGQLETFNTVALILCSLHSLINHSCDPNVIVQTYGGIEVTRAVQPISRGNQLFTDYGVNFMLHNIEERNKHLFEQYQFCCHCKACTNNWAIYTSLKGLNELYISDGDLLEFDKNNKLNISQTTLAKFNEVIHFLTHHKEINVNCLDFVFSFLNIIYSVSLENPCTIHYKCVEVIQKCLYYTSNQLKFNTLLN